MKLDALERGVVAVPVVLAAKVRPPAGEADRTVSVASHALHGGTELIPDCNASNFSVARFFRTVSVASYALHGGTELMSQDTRL